MQIIIYIYIYVYSVLQSEERNLTNCNYRDVLTITILSRILEDSPGRKVLEKTVEAGGGFNYGSTQIGSRHTGARPDLAAPADVERCLNCSLVKRETSRSTEKYHGIQTRGDERNKRNTITLLHVCSTRGITLQGMLSRNLVSKKKKIIIVRNIFPRQSLPPHPSNLSNDNPIHPTD